jgi:hypothetical protein
MARKDITDLQVIMSYLAAEETNFTKYPYDFLMSWTKQPQKVCYAAMERTHKRGLVDFGVSLRLGWVTELGWMEIIKLSHEQLYQDYINKRNKTC